MAALDLDKISGLLKPIIQRIPQTARGTDLHRRIRRNLLKNLKISFRVDFKRDS